MSNSNTKTFYESACNLGPAGSFSSWWGNYTVTNINQFQLAKKYAIVPGSFIENLFETPEESFMFLLFVALAEGEEF